MVQHLFQMLSNRLDGVLFWGYPSVTNLLASQVRADVDFVDQTDIDFSQHQNLQIWRKHENIKVDKIPNRLKFNFVER